MAIKALFPTGQDAITVTGLYQWDYGQVLEIESFDMGSEIVEVHFACTNMSEAIVRPCTFSDGIGTVAIPDDCLEQSTPITAWIYEIEGTQGKTRKVITLPVISRTRPSIARDIPTEISNRYTELITEVNEAVDALENGNVTVKQAQTATTADSAKTAGNASTANYATSAGSANKATYDKNGQPLTTCLHAENHLGFTPILTEGSVDTIIGGGIFAFTIRNNRASSSDTTLTRLITEVSGYETEYSPVISCYFNGLNLGQYQLLRLKFVSVGLGRFQVQAQRYSLDTEEWGDITSDLGIEYKRLSTAYPVG